MGRLDHAQQHLRLKQYLGEPGAVRKELAGSGPVCCYSGAQLAHDVPQLAAGQSGKHLVQAVLQGAVAGGRGTQQGRHLLRGHRGCLVPNACC
jgi:hypothetical protein